MFLAFQLSDIVTVPFGWLMAVLYHTTQNYGVAMIIFALAVQLVLTPINAKSKKSMMGMSRLAPQVQDIQRRYPNDPQKQNELTQKLYQDAGVSMGGGCLWSLIPMLILFPLFTVIRSPRKLPPKSSRSFRPTLPRPSPATAITPRLRLPS